MLSFCTRFQFLHFVYDAETRQHIPLITKRHWLFISSYSPNTLVGTYFPYGEESLRAARALFQISIFGSDDSRCSPEARKENEKTPITAFS